MRSEERVTDESAQRGPDARREADALRVVEDELTLLLRRSRSVSWDIAREVHPNLDANAYGLLLWLRRCGRTRLTDLAARLGLSKGTLSRQMTGLEQLGLVRRSPDPVDGRASLLELTDEGQRRFDLSRAERMGKLRRNLDSWPDGELTEFARLLGKFNASMEQ